VENIVKILARFSVGWKLRFVYRSVARAMSRGNCRQKKL